jgi:hypothetical protein
VRIRRETHERYSDRSRILAAMEARLRPTLATEGVLRDLKINGCFVADV